MTRTYNPDKRNCLPIYCSHDTEITESRWWDRYLCQYIPLLKLVTIWMDSTAYSGE